MKATCFKQNLLDMETQKYCQSTKKQREKNLKGPKCFFNFQNNRHKRGSYDFHNVEEEEPHYLSPLDKSNSCVSQ